MPEELPSKIHTGSLLDNLETATQAEVLGLRCITHPLIAAKTPFARMIQIELEKISHFDMKLTRFIRTKTSQGMYKLGPMGTITRDGYIQVMITRYMFKQSHLVYLWIKGCLPDVRKEMDHIDGNKLNDHPGNLRLISHTLNGRNRKMRKGNTSGYTGVSLVDSKYRSSIMVNGKNITIGRFNTAREAHVARQGYLQAHPELGFTTRHGL